LGSNPDSARAVQLGDRNEVAPILRADDDDGSGDGGGGGGGVQPVFCSLGFFFWLGDTDPRLQRRAQ
jgi:hypothetical protein